MNANGVPCDVIQTFPRCPLSKNVIRFHGTHINVTAYMPKTEVWSSVRRFSQNRNLRNSIACWSLMPYFTQIEQEMWKIHTEIHSCPYVKYGFHSMDSHKANIFL